MIKKIATYIIGTAAVFTAVYGVFAAVDTITDNQEDMIERMDHFSVEQTFMAEDITNIQDTLEQFETEHKAQGEDIKNLGWAIRNIENFTPEQMEEILDRTFKSNPISYRGEVEFIPIE